MRQSNGSQLFPANDSRGTTIGIIEVDPTDTRQDILTAILTQEKLDRKQTVVVMPEQHTAFRRASDFAALEQTIEGLQTQVVFIAAQDASIARFARRQHLSVFTSLERYAQYARTFLSQDTAEDVSTENNDTSTQPEEDPEHSTSPTPSFLTPSPSPTPTIADTATQPLPDQAVKTEDIPQALPTVPTANHATDDIPTDAPATAEDAPGPTPILLTAQPKQSLRHGPLRRKKSVDEEETIPAQTSRVTQSVQVPEISEAQTVPGPPPRAGLVPIAPNLPGMLPARSAHPPRRRLGRRGFMIILFALVLLIIGGTIFSGIEGFGPLARLFSEGTATITITPDNTLLNETYPFSAVTTPERTPQQVAARFLSATTAPKNQTVDATGSGTIPAQQAQGELTFYNSFPFPQTVPANTILTDSDGVQVINDREVDLDAAHSPVESSKTVPAHAVTPGVQGNITTLAINTTAQPGVTVQNIDAFTGGQNAQAFTYVQQSDIDKAVKTAENAIEPGDQQMISNQLQANEQPIGTTQCTPLITTNHMAGDTAQQVTVTVRETCVGEAYDQSKAFSLAENQLSTEALQKLGDAYALAGHFVTKVVTTRVTDQQGTTSLRIQVQGIWAYQFHGAWKTQVARLIAGKDITTAQTLLRKQTGMKQVTITMARGAGDTLPTDLQKIHIIVQPVTGL